MIKTTNVFSRNLQCYLDGNRDIINQGSSGSSKNWSILQLLDQIGRRKHNKTIHVVSITVPHLKDGAIKDFKDILMIGGCWDDSKWSDTDKTYTYDTKSYIKFLSIDKIGKATGPRRDILYLNECNNIPYPIVQQLLMRTRETAFYDFNPAGIFWINKRFANLYNEDFFIHSTYLDNPYLSKEAVAEIEWYRDNDPFMWKVYGLGELGVIPEIVFRDFKIYEDEPKGYDFKVYGLDFGFSTDPAALVQCVIDGRSLYLKELVYQTNLTNPELAELMRPMLEEDCYVVADSAEPKSIVELAREEILITPAKKGPDSIRHGIKRIKSFNLYLHKKSVNLQKEFNSYKYKRDVSGEVLPVPIDSDNHIIDAVRYAVTKFS